jgi:hypothetical protein
MADDQKPRRGPAAHDWARAERARIQAHQVAQHRCGRVLFAQTGRGGAERGPAFESGVSITRVDQIQDVGKFLLAKQGVGADWQIIRLFTSKAGI